MKSEEFMYDSYKYMISFKRKIPTWLVPLPVCNMFNKNACILGAFVFYYKLMYSF